MPTKRKTAAEKAAEKEAEEATVAQVATEPPLPLTKVRSAPEQIDAEALGPPDTPGDDEIAPPPGSESALPCKVENQPTGDDAAGPTVPEFCFVEEEHALTIDGVSSGSDSDVEDRDGGGRKIMDGADDVFDGLGPDGNDGTQVSDNSASPLPTECDEELSGADDEKPGGTIADDHETDNLSPSEESPSVVPTTVPEKRAEKAGAAGPAKGDRTPEVAERKGSLRAQNVRSLDRDLTPEERKEWEAIYASYTSKSILTGVVQGVDMNTFTIRNAEGLLETKKMASAVIISHRVKVLVPELEFSMPEFPLPEQVVHYLDQCIIDYVIISVDREHNLAIASRRLAMSARRRYFRTAPRGHEVGEELMCRVLSVGPTRCTVECNGYDQEIRAADMGYNYIEDLREEYRPGDELRCRLVSYSPKDGLKISVKEAQRHPFDGAVERHPIGCRRHATITNKDSGSIFCLLADDVSCVCRYSAQLNDADFEIGDTVSVVVDSYYLEGRMLRGKILRKW